MQGDPKWMVMNGISHVLDHKNLTKAQRVCFELDAHAYWFIMDALSLEVFYRVDKEMDKAKTRAMQKPQ
jgi:hypothetical protein